MDGSRQKAKPANICIRRSREDSHLNRRKHHHRGRMNRKDMGTRTSQVGETTATTNHTRIEEAGETTETRGHHSLGRTGTGELSRSGMRMPRGTSMKQEKKEPQMAAKYQNL